MDAGVVVDRGVRVGVGDGVERVLSNSRRVWRA